MERGRWEMLKDGYTLMHEHVAIDLSGVKRDPDCRLNCFEETLEEWKELYRCGVRNVLEVTNMGMGRDVSYIKRMAEASGIQFLFSTGFYKEPFLPQIVYEKTAGELADLAEKEIREGIGDTGVRASVIGEFGTSKNEMTAMEEKVFQAMALAAVRTGAPVTTHTTLGTFGEEQADYLIGHGIKPEKIIIGHMDLSRDFGKIWRLLEKGVNIGFDTIGKLSYCPDTFRAEALRKIAEGGRLSQVVLSMDITRKSHLKSRGGIGYGYLFTEFLPLLKEYGISQEQIETLLIYNPKRILGGQGRRGEDAGVSVA